MSTTAPIKPPMVRKLPSIGEMLWEVLPLVGAVVVAGPPVVLLAAPLTLGALMLAGPFALMTTAVFFVVAVVVAAAWLVELVRAVVAVPRRLGHHLREQRATHPRHLVTVHSRHAAA